jgi:hypothetical protein
MRWNIGGYEPFRRFNRGCDGLGMQHCAVRDNFVDVGINGRICIKIDLR